MIRRTLAAGAFAALTAFPAFAQAPAAPVPGWAVGRPEGSTLAPHAPRLTVTPLDQVPVGAIRLPPGFQAEVFAHGMPGVRAIAEGPNGTLFAGTRGIGRVYAITRNADGTTRTRTIAQGLPQPNGLVMIGNSLFVFAVNRVLRYDNIEANLDNVAGAGGPDRRLRPADRAGARRQPSLEVRHPRAGRPDLYECRRELQRVRHGPRQVRAAGLLQPRRQRPADRGARRAQQRRHGASSRDARALGDQPRPRLGRQRHAGGYRCCASAARARISASPSASATWADPQYNRGRNCSEFSQPAALLGPHTAVLGMRFYTGTMFPEQYRNQIFIARRGSWNRERLSGYDVVVAHLDAQGNVTRIEEFLTGFRDDANQRFADRPVEVHVLRDGSMLVSGEQMGAIYRITYRR